MRRWQLSGGFSYSETNKAARAFRWSSASGYTHLGTLGGKFSFANGISDSGAEVVGRSGRASGAQHAFRWTEAGGMQDVGSLSQDGESSANGVSGDGLVVVGESYNGTINCLSAGAGGYLGEADNDAKQRIGQIGAGMRLNEHFTVGANGSLAQVDLDRNDAQQRSAYALNLWAAYQ